MGAVLPLAVLLVAPHAGSVGAPSALAAGHPDSLSRSYLTVDGPTVTLELRFQTLSLIEVLPELDRDHDGRLSEAELSEGRAEIEAYVLARYRLEPAGGAGPLEGSLESLGLLGASEAGPFDLQWMRATFVFRSDRPVGSFSIEVRLFQEKNPWHRDICSVVWNGEAEVRHLFVIDAAAWTFEPEATRRPGVVAFFLRLGVQHILRGYDHLAFLLVLIVASRRFRTLVGVVTAFTLAHSLTLAFAALDPGGLLARIPGRFVELAIALSIAYVACENLMVKEARNPWIEAFGFGLLHGLGFASFLGDALEGENLVASALFGFNVGVEIGQLAFVVLVAGPLWIVTRGRRREEEEPAGLAPRRLRLLVSAVVAALAFYWFAERAGWVG